MARFSLTPRRALVASLAFVAQWQALSWGLPALKVFSYLSTIDFVGWTGLFLIGLTWTIYLLESLSQRYERRRVESELALGGDRVNDVLGSVGGDICRSRRRTWNFFDLAAWYYGRNSQRLKQSFLALAMYVVFFVVLYFALNARSTSAIEPFELPSGGGQEMAPQQVQIKKVVRKKYIINPYSNVRMGTPPDDPVKEVLEKETRNEYTKGQGAEGGAIGRGDGKDGGYGFGTGRGKVRFVRLRHADRGWDRNFGIGGDNNILAEFGARTGISRAKISEASEAIDVEQLASLEPKVTPPLVYVGGVARFSLTPREKKVLRDYLVDRHGMVLGDNLGGPAFHQQFLATMTELTGVTPVPIPRDDYIHTAPFAMSSLPIVVAHGGTVPLGWKLDGRWVVYYHPGALSDAWRDDHSGIKREIYEMCYQLGVNIMAYSFRERDKWLESQK